MNKKNVIIGSAILAATFGILISGSLYWTKYNENKNKVMAEELKEREIAKAQTTAMVQPTVQKEETASHNPAIAIKPGKSYTARKAELKEKIAKKKVTEKKKKKAKAKKNKEFVVDGIDYSGLFNNDTKKVSEDDRYAATLSTDERKAYKDKIKKNKKKKLKADKNTVPNSYKEQTQGNIVKVDKGVVKDKNGKTVKNKKAKADWNDIINSCLKDKNGKLIDNSEEASNKRYAKEHGLTVEEVEKMVKDGYFNNGESQTSFGSVGDGSPEDDAGMDFQ